MTAREEGGARWRRWELGRGKQRLTDSTLETGGLVGGWADELVGGLDQIRFEIR